MDKYNVTGMSCAACSARVEKAVSKLPGVESCAVNLLTNSMNVEGSAGTSEVIRAVEAAGYGASLATKPGADLRDTQSTAGKPNNNEESQKENVEYLRLKKRFLASLGFWLVLMYFSMGHMMWNWPIPGWFHGNHVAMGLLQLILAVMVMVINQRFFVSGFKGLIHRAPNMDTLVALGASASFVWSLYALFAMTDAQLNLDLIKVQELMDDLYFESAATILTLITVGKMLEARSKGKTTDALKSLIKLAPKQATIIRADKEITVDIEKVGLDDIFIVKPGESIPVDGIVIEGVSAVNEAALTGESIPVDKEAGTNVYAATINQSGFLKCRATKIGEETMLSQIIQMVSDAAASKAPIAKIADRVSGVFVPVVLGISLLTLFGWIFVGGDMAFSLARAISVLVISCPCALGLATPVAIMVGNGVAAKCGILFKNAVSLEQAGKGKVVVLDKTGTITKGEPVVTDIALISAADDRELLEYAYLLESKSEHPLAKAIVDETIAHRSKTGSEKEFNFELTEFKVLPGNGLMGLTNDEKIVGGNLELIKKEFEISNEWLDRSKEFAMDGKTPIFFAKGKKLLGIIAVADDVKEDSKEAIEELKALGMTVVMLTGDNEQTANSIGKRVGVDKVIAGVLPNQKEEEVVKLQKASNGRVIMVGDGINDAPALTRADIGIAIGAGTDVAIDAADIVLLKNSLKDVAAAIRISRRTLLNIKENLFWAFIYNIIGIPLAAGVFIPLFGWKLNPMFGAAAMSLSSFCVVTNALRLNMIRPYGKKSGKTKKGSIPDKEINKATIKEKNSNKYLEESNIEQNINIEEKEKKEMTKTMIIEGMMCGHCEARVKKTLEEMAGVTEAIVSHEQGTAIVKSEGEISDEALKTAVEAQDYKVVDIK